MVGKITDFLRFFSTEKIHKIRQILKIKKIRKIRILDL